MSDNNITESLLKVLKNRWGSVMYGTFIVSWGVWNWEAIYITLFVDQKLIFDISGQLKIYYVASQYLWGWFIPFAWSLIKLFIGPIVSTFVIIWWLSKLEFICFKKDYSREIEKKKERIKQEEGLVKSEGKVLKQEKVNVDLAKQIKDEMSEEQKWNNEYKELSNNKAFKSVMNQFKSCLYDHKGLITVLDPFTGTNSFEMPSDELAYLDTNGLATFNSNDRDRIVATNKGRYFLKSFMNSNVSKWG